MPSRALKSLMIGFLGLALVIVSLLLKATATVDEDTSDVFLGISGAIAAGGIGLWLLMLVLCNRLFCIVTLY